MTEAEIALAEFLEKQRQRCVASDILSAAFRDGEIGSNIDAGATSGPEAEPNYEDAKQAAREYAQARNSGARFRHYAQDNESQRAGLASALDWLSRKKKSAIKK
jgi:hypothetical protein